MSIDTSPIEMPTPNPLATVKNYDWEHLIHGKSKSPAKVFGSAAKDGGIYRWGMTVAATRLSVDDDDSDRESMEWDNDRDDQLLALLSRLACDAKHKSKKSTAAVDWSNAADEAMDSFRYFQSPTTQQAAMAVVLGGGNASVVGRQLDEQVCVDLAAALLELHESFLVRDDVSSHAHLILGGELGLTLATRLPGLPGRKAILQNACDAVIAWADRESDSMLQTRSRVQHRRG